MPVITKIEARFINAAVRRDELRTNLTHPHVTEVEGALWVVATDGHRMHAVPAPAGCAVGYITLGKDGTIHAVDHGKAKFPPVHQIWGDHYHSVEVEVEVERIQALAGGRHKRLHLAFGAGDECRTPRAFLLGDPVSDSQVAIWAGYAADALLAVPTKGRGAHESVLMSRTGSHDPVIIRDRVVPTWRALIMPVRAKCA